jgi:hypothetical protein
MGSVLTRERDVNVSDGGAEGWRGDGDAPEGNLN